MSKNRQSELLKFEPGSKQPFILFMIAVIILSAVIIIAALFSSGVSLGSKDKSDRGDINGDGKIDSADILLIMNHISGAEELTGDMLKRADINSDKSVNSNDAYALVQYVNQSGGQVDIQAITAQSSQPESTSQPTQGDAQSEPENSDEPDSTDDLLLTGKSYSSAFLTGENKLYYSARIVNRWQSADSANMYQIELKVKNNSEKTIYNTSADISFTSPVSVESYNGCTVKENESGALKVRTSNEGSVLPGGTYSCSFVVSCAQETEISSVTKQ